MPEDNDSPAETAHRHLSPLLGLEGSPVLLNGAAHAVGERCRDGIPLASIPPESWWIEDNRVHIPYPGSSFRYPSPPNREDLEKALNAYHHLPSLSAWSTRKQFRALKLLSDALSLPARDAQQWRNVYVHRKQSQLRNLLRASYFALLHSGGDNKTAGIKGCWEGSRDAEIGDVLAEVKRSFDQPIHMLKNGRRARLWEGDLWGEPVVIKEYRPNPRPWRRRIEVCRARRAWAGANILLQASISVPQPLGWIEITSGPEAGTSYFISQSLPTSETVRSWLRREWKGMTPTEHIQFRHDLRRHLLEMYTKGLVHLDCKLSNIRLPAGRSSGPYTFIWTDLEDIRPQVLPHRTFIRNLYQLNGSLSRDVPESVRVQFLKGFKRTFPFASAPWVIWYVKRVTRRRHRRELRRQCGA